MVIEGHMALRDYLLKTWPTYRGEPIIQSLFDDWRLSDSAIGITNENSTLN